MYISDGLFQIVTKTWLISETQQKTSLLAFGRIAPVSATGRDAVVGAWNMDRMRNLLPGHRAEETWKPDLDGHKNIQITGFGVS